MFSLDPLSWEFLSKMDVEFCQKPFLHLLKWFCYCLVAKSCQTHLCPHGLQPTRLLCPWGFPGKNTGMGYISFSRGSSWPRNQSHVSCIGRQIIYHWATWEAHWDYYMIFILYLLMWYSTWTWICGYWAILVSLG